FRAASAPEAERVVRAFLDAMRAKDARAASQRLCGPISPLTDDVGDYDVVRVEPGWVGTEPYFRVDVALAKGAPPKSLSVRARTACIDRVLGEPAIERGSLERSPSGGRAEGEIS